MAPTPKPPIERFVRFVRRCPSGCWEWQGRRESGGMGYGRFYLDGRMRWAHRVAYALFVGPIPPGLDVCHHCDNPPCVNPAHLFTGTRADNMADAVAKGRSARGEANASARLSPVQVAEIRARYVAGVVLQRMLAVEYGVSRSAIGMIVRGERWANG